LLYFVCCYEGEHANTLQCALVVDVGGVDG
jgi:hypothetical protein